MLSISFPWDRCSSYYNAQQLSVFLVTTTTYFHLSIIIQEILVDNSSVNTKHTIKSLSKLTYKFAMESDSLVRTRRKGVYIYLNDHITDVFTGV